MKERKSKVSFFGLDGFDEQADKAVCIIAERTILLFGDVFRFRQHFQQNSFFSSPRNCASLAILTANAKLLSISDLAKSFITLPPLIFYPSNLQPFNPLTL